MQLVTAFNINVHQAKFTQMNLQKLTPISIAFSPPMTVVQPVATLVQQPLFTAALLHEVRSPLTNINLAVGMLTRLTSGVKEKTYLDIILRASNHINTLVADLVSTVVERKEHSLHQLLDEALVLTADRITLKNITVSKEYAPDDYTGMLDSVKMKIALTNIIVNAIDAMPDNNGELRIFTASVNGKFILRIEDNGCGISKDNLERIFEPYYSQKAGGLGIGLAATLTILKTNKVNITVESAIGTGTTFILSFSNRKPLPKKAKSQPIAISKDLQIALA